MTSSYPSSAIPTRQAGAFYALYFAVLGVVLPFLGPYLLFRGMGAVWVGLITGAFSLAKLAYAPFLGAWVDRGRWFPGLLTAHVTLSMVVAVALSRVHAPWAMCLAFVFIGLGYGSVLPLVEAVVLQRLPERGYGALRVWGSLGFVAAATVAAWILGSDRMDRFPLCLAVAMMALAATCMPLENAARPHCQPRQGGLPGVVWGLLALLTLHQVSHGPYYAFFSIHLRQHGMSGGVVGGLWSLGVVAELVAFISGRKLEARLGLRRLLGLALLVTPLRWLLLALPPSPATLVLAQVGHAASFALAHLAGVQLVQRAVPEGAVRHAQALYSGLGFGLGTVVGSALAGPAYAAWDGTGAFLAAAVLSGVIFLVWLPLARRFRPSSSRSAAATGATST